MSRLSDFLDAFKAKPEPAVSADEELQRINAVRSAYGMPAFKLPDAGGTIGAAYDGAPVPMSDAGGTPTFALPKPLPLAPATTGTGPALPTPHHTATVPDNIVKLLPRWQCHKVVRAARIDAVHGAIITLDMGGGRRMPIAVEPKIFARYTPTQGDYLVVYDDGFMSISPGAAFDSGYYRL
jgi:hypothetical protein